MLTAIIGIFIGLVMCFVVIGAGYLIEVGPRKKKPARRVLVNGQQVDHCPRCGLRVDEHTGLRWVRCQQDLLHAEGVVFLNEGEEYKLFVQNPDGSRGLKDSNPFALTPKHNPNNVLNHADVVAACRHELEMVYTHIPGTDNEEYLVGCFCKIDSCDYQDADPSWVSLGFPSGASTTPNPEHG